MFVTEEDIEEAAVFRPYQSLSDRGLADLLDAYESFLPSLANYGVVVEGVLGEGQAVGRDGNPPRPLRLLSQIEPEVSKSLYEILLEIATRIHSKGDPQQPKYWEWTERGLFYGFTAEDIDRAFGLRDEQRP